MGLHLHFRQASLLSLAARCRTFMASNLFPAVVDQIREINDSDDVLVQKPHLPWFKASMIYSIADAHSIVHAIIAIPAEHNLIQKTNVS